MTAIETGRTIFRYLVTMRDGNTLAGFTIALGG